MCSSAVARGSRPGYRCTSRRRHAAAAPHRSAPRRASCKSCIFVALHVIEPYVVVYSRPLLFEEPRRLFRLLSSTCLPRVTAANTSPSYTRLSFVFAFSSHTSRYRSNISDTSAINHCSLFTVGKCYELTKFKDGK